MYDPALSEIYSQRLKELGATVKEARPLDQPMGTANRRGPLCGSDVTFQVNVDAAGTVTALGYHVNACALSAAAAGIVAAAAVGSSVDELRAVRDAVRSMLRGESDDLPGGKWADLVILGPAAMVRSRHGSTLLPFETVIEAMENAAR